MDLHAFMIAKATLLFLAAVLTVEYAIRRRALGKESEPNRKRREQFAALSSELNLLKTELSRKNEIADQIPRIAKKMMEKLPADAYPAIAVRSVKEFFHAGKVGYFVPSDGSSDYLLEVGAGFPPDWQGAVKVDSGMGILGMALRKKTVVSREDFRSSDGPAPSRRSLEGMGVIPDFVAPVFGSPGGPAALVIAGCPFPLDRERIYVPMLADFLSMSMRNASLLDSGGRGSWADPLTGVSSRLHFLQRFENEIRRTENYRQALALLMFDIDGFKRINDTHGHPAGDVVIRKMAEVARRNTRGSDLVGRYGGDEFMILITSTTVEQALSFAEKLREKVSATDIPVPGSGVPVRITISGGLAMFPAHGQTTSELLKAADEALYESKRRGRNRVLLASSVGLDPGDGSSSSRP